MNYQEIGRRVRIQRTVLGMSQETLAEVASISPVYVSQIERAVKHASLDVLLRLADALGMSLGQLLGEGPRAAPEQMNSLLGDCSAQERHVILSAATAIKNAMRDREMPASTETHSKDG